MLKQFLAILGVSVLMVLNAVVATAAQHDAAFSDKYELSKMVVLSRHNIRSPLSGSGATIDELTPHKWFAWTSAPSELSLKGGQLETIMGQYFRRYLAKEKLIMENYLPQAGEVRFYANSKQRTIATAHYFSAGMLPIANITIEHKYDPENTDMTFSPRLIFMSEEFKAEAQNEISRMKFGDWRKGAVKKLAENYLTLEKILDFKDSPMARQKSLKHLIADDPEILLEQGKQPSVKGTLKIANAAADALILQYYEESDDAKDGFGRKLTDGEWAQISNIKAVYDGLLFTAPDVAVNVAHPLVKLIDEELSLPNRKFTFLCGHDSNIASVLAALGVEDYTLPNAIEPKTPIGSKFVIEKWVGRDGEEYASLSLVYQSVAQLRARSSLTPDNPPMIYRLELKGLQKNRDGLYLMRDVKDRFQKTLDAYDELGRVVNRSINDEERQAA